MRILFLSHYFVPEGNAPACRVYEFCKRWVSKGHKVTVVTCVPNVPDGVVYPGYKNKIYQRQNIDGIGVIRVWTYIAANKGVIRRIINYISYLAASVFFSLFIRRPDVIIATSPQFFCGLAGVILGKRFRVPLILEIRDIWPDSITAVGALSNPVILSILEWLELKMYDSACRIVTVGQGYKTKLVKKGVRDSNIFVVPNGVSKEFLQPREIEYALVKKYGLDSYFICSYVGTVGMACGLDVIISAAQLLKANNRYNIKFLVVGSGAVKDDLQERAVRGGLDNIVFAGRQDKALIPDFISISDVCLVHLKKRDIFKTVLPSKIFEAAAMQKPIILGVEGFAEQLVKEENMGLCIEPDNPRELISALEKLAGDKRLAESLGESGRKYVMRHHDYDDLASKYLDILNSAGGKIYAYSQCSGCSS